MQHYSFFDSAHWQRVKAARHAQAKPDLTTVFPAHALVGKSMVDKLTGAAFTVWRVERKWLQGWYHEAVLMNAAEPERCVVVGNETSVNPAVLHRHTEFVENYRATGPEERP